MKQVAPVTLHHRASAHLWLQDSYVDGSRHEADTSLGPGIAVSSAWCCGMPPIEGLWIHVPASHPLELRS